MSEFTAPTFNRRLRPRRSLFVVVTVAALQSIAVAVDDLPEWGSPGPTSRCRGVSLWCTGPTRAPLKIHHYQLLYFSMILITSFALPRSSRSSRHFACMLILAARPFRAQPNILFSFIHQCQYCAPPAQPITLSSSFVIVGKKVRKKTRTC